MSSARQVPLVLRALLARLVILVRKGRKDKPGLVSKALPGCLVLLGCPVLRDLPVQASRVLPVPRVLAARVLLVHRVLLGRPE